LENTNIKDYAIFPVGLLLDYHVPPVYSYYIRLCVV